MAVSNSLAPVKKDGGSFSCFMTSDAVKNKVNSIIGGKDGDRFIVSITSAVSTNPALLAPEVDKPSILSCALLGESLKLTPSPQLGYYYMLPFNDKKSGMKVVAFVMGYRGYIQLAMRSGFYKSLNVLEIKQGELKYWNPLTEEISVDIIEDDTKRVKLPTTHYVAFFEYLNGFRKTICWSKDKMIIHANEYSPTFNAEFYKKLQNGYQPTDWKEQKAAQGFWYTDFDSQARKTMLRQLLSKWGIMSIEMQKAFAGDGAVVNDEGTPQMYVDNDGAGNLPEPEKQPEPEAPKRTRQPKVGTPVAPQPTPAPEEYQEPVMDEDGGDPFANAEPVQSSDDEYKLQEILDHIAIATNRAELSGAKMEGKQYGLNAEMMSKIEKAIQKRTLSIG